ncbi:MAG: single-stranded-DNA-specific exonuclease RecJ, partial [Candidatus Aenigmarchaeota archaeon]|nr:single-stranded-DNA-specific exonuclease RecJ [Candidatus Aenigmarchaeota archaeon]
PTIILERRNKELKGSARSISSFDITSVLRECENCLSRYGGHSKAAGLSLKPKNLKLFKEKISRIAKKTLKEKDFSPILKIDKELKLDELTSDFKKSLENFEPFGIGNFEPIFCSNNLEILDFKSVGNSGNHLKLWVKDKGKTFEAIGFRQAERLGNLNPKGPINIAFKLTENNWNGYSSLQLEVLDLKRS